MTTHNCQNLPRFDRLTSLRTQARGLRELLPLNSGWGAAMMAVAAKELERKVSQEEAQRCASSASFCE